MTVEQLTREAQGPHRIIGAVTACRVRKNRVSAGRQGFEQRGLVRILADVGAADRDGNDLGAARFHGAARLVEVPVLSRSDQPARAIGPPGDEERIGDLIGEPRRGVHRASLDRKSTRLNSSHRTISYAVFCLKKKNTKFSCTFYNKKKKKAKHLIT